MKVICRLVDHPGEHPCEFSEADWQRLATFRTFAEELSTTRLLSNPGCSDFRIRWAGGDEKITFEPREMPDPDEFRAFLHLMRPFVLEKEPTFYPHIRSILSRQLHSTPFGRLLDEQLRVFRGQRCQEFTFVADGVMLNSDQTLMKWLNAYEYHRDEEKRRELEALHDPLPIEFSKGLWGGMMIDKAMATLELAWWVKATERGMACRRIVRLTPLQWESEGF